MNHVPTKSSIPHTLRNPEFRQNPEIRRDATGVTSLQLLTNKALPYPIFVSPFQGCQQSMVNSQWSTVNGSKKRAPHSMQRPFL